MNTIFFNRVPKCGSESFRVLINKLGKLNNFKVYRERLVKFYTPMHNYSSQQKIAEWIVDLQEPAAYLEHVNFINFTRYNLQKPIYVNMVRDPVERVISTFYFQRAPWSMVIRKKLYPDSKFPEMNWLRKDYETCVRKGDSECLYIQGSKNPFKAMYVRQTLFFCGHEIDRCMPFNTQKVLQIAKVTVEKYYAVVGTWEDRDVTLAVFENYIPMFFRNASAVFNGTHKILANSNDNTFKPTISEELKDIVRRNFTKEIEFYQFCRQRLHKQYLALKIDKNYNY